MWNFHFWSPKYREDWTCWRNDDRKNILKSLPVLLHQPSHPGLCFIFYFVFIHFEALQGNSTRFKAKGNALCCPWKKRAAGTWWWFFFLRSNSICKHGWHRNNRNCYSFTSGNDFRSRYDFFIQLPCQKAPLEIVFPPCLCLSVFVTPAACK